MVDSCKVIYCLKFCQPNTPLPKQRQKGGGALPRTPSTGSSADSLADSVMSHPLAAEAAPASAAVRRGRPGFTASLVKAIVPLAAVGVAAAAGMQHRTRRPSPASRKAQASRFPEPKQVPFADPKPAAFRAQA